MFKLNCYLLLILCSCIFVTTVYNCVTSIFSNSKAYQLYVVITSMKVSNKPENKDNKTIHVNIIMRQRYSEYRLLLEHVLKLMSPINYIINVFYLITIPELSGGSGVTLFNFSECSTCRFFSICPEISLWSFWSSENPKRKADLT